MHSRSTTPPPTSEPEEKGRSCGLAAGAAAPGLAMEAQRSFEREGIYGVQKVVCGVLVSSSGQLPLPPVHLPGKKCRQQQGSRDLTRQGSPGPAE